MPNNTPNIVPVLPNANDEFHRGARHRSLPIPETMTHVPDYPAKLRIYKIAASLFWQMRCHFKGKTYTKTTQTTSKRRQVKSNLHKSALSSIKLVPAPNRNSLQTSFLPQFLHNGTHKAKRTMGWIVRGIKLTGNSSVSSAQLIGANTFSHFTAGKGQRT